MYKDEEIEAAEQSVARLWAIWFAAALQSHKVQLGFLTLTKLHGLGIADLREKLDTWQT